MQTELISKNGLVSDFKITIPQNDIQRHAKEWLADQAKGAKVDGFRPGKVPVSYMEKRYGDQARRVAIEHFMTQSIEGVVKEHKITTADQPEIKVESKDEGKDFIFSASFEAQPEFKLVDDKKISFEKLDIKLDPKAVKDALDNLLKSHKEKNKDAKLDDELAKSYGAENLEGLKKKIEETYKRDQNELSWIYTKRQILDQMESLYSFDLPKRMIKKEFERIWQQALKDIEKEGDADKDSLKEQREIYQKLAERRIKLGFIVAHMTKEHDIKMSQEEINQAVYNEMMRYPEDAKKIIEYYQTNPGAVRDLTAPYLEDKVIQHIADNAKSKESSVTPQEAQKKLEAIMPVDGKKKAKKASSQKSTKKAKMSDKE